MIELNTQLCEELGLDYWKLNTAKQIKKHRITHEEKELLRKILLAKAITLTDDMLEVHSKGVVIVKLPKIQLKFENVNLTDTTKRINLAKISDMLNNVHFKKLTWLKLKNLDI